MKKIIYSIILLITNSCSATDLDILANFLSTATKENIKFNLKTSVSHLRMDCLKVIPAEDYETNNDHFYGVCHCNIDGVWTLYLAETEDVIDGTWNYVITLSETGTMGYLYHDP